MSTHGPIKSEWRDTMNSVMAILDKNYNPDRPRKVGIVILMFEYGAADGGRTNYISNGADRADMIKLFRELADRFEGTHPDER